MRVVNPSKVIPQEGTQFDRTIQGLEEKLRESE